MTEFMVHRVEEPVIQVHRKSIVIAEGIRGVDVDVIHIYLVDTEQGNLYTTFSISQNDALI